MKVDYIIILALTVFISCKAVKTQTYSTVDIVYLSSTQITLVNLNGMDVIYDVSVKYNGDTAFVNFKRSLFFSKLNDKIELKDDIKFIVCEGKLFNVLYTDISPFRLCK